MYYNSVWPGAYSFKNEIKLIIQMLQRQLNSLLERIEAAEKKLG